MPSHPYCGRWNTPTREKKGERMNAMSLLSRLRRPGGVHLAHHKDASGIPTEKMPLPTQIVLPMGQHLGAPCQPVVTKGDHVDVGTLVGKAGGFVSADIHSGVSGTVLKLDPIYYNSHTTVVVIQPDGQQTLDPSIRPPQVEDRESFLQAVRDCGLVGLGGAGFPTAVKLNPKNLSEIDTFIVNAAECEPYLCADHREMMECPDDVVAGIEAVMRWLDLPRCVIAIESNKPDAIALMKEKTAHLSKVSVQALPSTYPQGAEKVIIYSVTGRELPRGALPADVGVIVDNVTTVAEIGRFLRTGIPLTTKRLTVTGDLMDRPRNLSVIIGTPIGEVLDYCKPKAEPRKIITGGPMMGVSQMDVNYPITRQNNGLLVLSEKASALPEPEPCIRCGRCISACPAGLSPVEIHDAYHDSNLDELLRLDADLCMGCGCCSYICPAKRSLTQASTLARDLLKERGLKKNG